MEIIKLLEKKYVEGSEKLSILQRYGTICGISDFAILLCGYTTKNYKSKVPKEMKNIGDWLLESYSEYATSNSVTVTTRGEVGWNSSDTRYEGIRPALDYSLIKNIIDKNKKKQNKDGTLEVEFGDYPQSIVDESTSNILESLYNRKNLKETGKSYTTDSVSMKYEDRKIPFTPRQHIEYEFDNERYIRIVAPANIYSTKLESSNDREIKEGSIYWVKVEPIKWLVDEKANIALSKTIIASGVRVNGRTTVKAEKCDMKNFLDKCLYKDMFTEWEKSALEQEGLVKSAQAIVGKLIRPQSNFSLLNYLEAFWGDTLKVPLRNQAELTDFATALGAMKEEYNGKNYGPFWTRAWSTKHNHVTYTYDEDLRENMPTGTAYSDDYPLDTCGNYGSSRNANSDYISSVITVPYDDIKNLVIEKNYSSSYSSSETGYKPIPVLTIKAGEYPQTIAPENMQKELEEARKQGKLIETGKTYTIDGTKIEYEYKGKKYIRHSVITDKLYTHRKEIKLSDGKNYKTGDEIWIEVEPIEWVVSEEQQLAVTKKAIFSGVSFDKRDKYYGDFENTVIKKFLDEHFAKEIIPSRLQKPKTNYTLQEIEQDEYLRKEISEMRQEDKERVIASLTKELKETIEKIREYSKELDVEFGKIFDQEIKKEQTKEHKKQKVKVQVKTRER